MDLFGEQLKEIRLEKKYSIEQIARDTKISRKYLEAIENNDFSVFPSETYLIGFLRSYTEYLGLDSTKYINQYRNYKIQEQPIPINELLDIKKRIHPALVVVLIVIGVAVVAVGSILIYNYAFNRPAVTEVSETPPTEAPAVATESNTYTFTDEVATAWFSSHDRILIPLGEQEYEVTVAEVGEPVVLQFEDKDYRLTADNEVILNLNHDDNQDLRIILNTIEEREERQQAYLGLYKITAAITSTTLLQDTPTAEPVEVSGEAETGEAGTETTEPGIVESTGETQVILEADKIEPFTINITFKGHCLFRYLQDNSKRFERFFLKDEIIEIPEVNRVIKLWMSNAGSVDARISGKRISFGRAGQVVTKVIQWRQDPATDTYKLELASIY